MKHRIFIAAIVTLLFAIPLSRWIFQLAKRQDVQRGELVLADMMPRDVSVHTDVSHSVSMQKLDLMMNMSGSEEFERLTDKWTQPAATEISLSDVEDFAKKFRQVPKNCRLECVHRALNLIPDENIMLLAGLLMDRSVEQEIVTAVFHDILNRDESVKMPFLKEVYKDRSNPCWKSAALVLKVAGCMPDESAHSGN